MRRRSLLIAVLVLAVVPLGGPAATSASATDGSQVADVATLDAHIARAQRRIERWYGRIERWYGRIDRAASRVDRLEALVEDPAGAPTAALERTRHQSLDPTDALAEANDHLRFVLTDPWARHVQGELDAWNAFLGELVRARERALIPVPEETEPRDPEPAGRLDPRAPVTYVGWAKAFLRHLGAPRCEDNLLIVVTWETAESTAAAFNPLATTRDMPGDADMNSVGVKHYTSIRQGLEASRDTLLRGAESYLYGEIVDSLRACAPAEVTARAINASAWCRGCVDGAYITGLLPIVRASYDEHAARLFAAAA